jgi:hypothetical protein
MITVRRELTGPGGVLEHRLRTVLANDGSARWHRFEPCLQPAEASVGCLNRFRSVLHPGRPRELKWPKAAIPAIIQCSASISRRIGSSSRTSTDAAWVDRRPTAHPKGPR